MQHQTVPQTREILAHELTAGMTVIDGTDGPLVVTERYTDGAVAIGVRFAGVPEPTRYGASALVEILAEPVTEPIAASYRVTFDVMAGIEPMTFPSTTTTDQVAYQVQRAFVAADDMHPENAQVAIDMEAGTVVVSVDGDVIEHGSITRVDEQPPAKPDYWLTLADDLRQAADRIATLAGTETRPAHVALYVLGSVVARDAERMVPLVDALAAAFDTTAGVSDERRDEHRATAEVGAVKVCAYTFVPEAEDAEKATMRAELETLRAQLAKGGTR